MFPKRRITMGGDVFRDEHSVIFDGTNDYISIGANAALYPNDADWAISFWFKSTNAEEDFIVSGGDENDKGFFQFKLKGNASGEIRCFLYDKDNTQELAFNTAATGLNDGAWHHFAYTLDWSAKKGYAYVDGVLSQSAANTNVVTLANDDDGIHIGKKYNASSKYFTGSVSEMAIYNRFLSASEVTQIYNGGEPFNHMDSSFKSNLQGWWRMGDGALDSFGDNGLIDDEVDPTIGGEIIVNGTFTGNTSPWSLGSPWAYDDNNVTCSANNNNLSQDISAVAGETYKVKVSITAYTSGTLICDLGGSEDIRLIFDQSTNNNMVGYLTALNTNDLRFYGGAFRGTIDNITVYKVFGTPGIMMNMSQSNYTGDTP